MEEDIKGLIKERFKALKESLRQSIVDIIDETYDGGNMAEQRSTPIGCKKKKLTRPQ